MVAASITGCNGEGADTVLIRPQRINSFHGVSLQSARTIQYLKSLVTKNTSQAVTLNGWRGALGFGVITPTDPGPHFRLNQTCEYLESNFQEKKLSRGFMELRNRRELKVTTKMLVMYLLYGILIQSLRSLSDLPTKKS